MANWYWKVFLAVPGGSYSSYLQWMISAWGWTVSVAVCSMMVALPLGSVIGIAQSLNLRLLNAISQSWIELFRNIPLILQVFLWYQVMPVLIPSLQRVPNFALIVAALGLYTSARIAVQVFSGIRALPHGQKSAGLALGLSTAQCYWYVVMPMAYRIILPALTTEMMSIIKNSSVAFAVSIGELTMFAMQAQEETGHGVEIYLAVTALYTVSAFSVNRLMRFIEQRTQIPGSVSQNTRGVVGATH